MKINTSPYFACQKQSANEPNILTAVKIRPKMVSFYLFIEWDLFLIFLQFDCNQQCVEEFRYIDREHIFILNKIQIFGSAFIFIYFYQIERTFRLTLKNDFKTPLTFLWSPYILSSSWGMWSLHSVSAEGPIKK